MLNGRAVLGKKRAFSAICDKKQKIEKKEKNNNLEYNFKNNVFLGQP